MSVHHGSLSSRAVSPPRQVTVRGRGGKREGSSPESSGQERAGVIYPFFGMAQKASFLRLPSVKSNIFCNPVSDTGRPFPQLTMAVSRSTAGYWVLRLHQPGAMERSGGDVPARHASFLSGICRLRTKTLLGGVCRARGHNHRVRSSGQRLTRNEGHYCRQG